MTTYLDSLDTLDATLGTITTDIATLDSRVDGIDTTLTAYDTRLDALESSTVTDGDLDALEAADAAMAADIATGLQFEVEGGFGR